MLPPSSERARCRRAPHRRVRRDELPADPRRASRAAYRPDAAAHRRLRPERTYESRGGSNTDHDDQSPSGLGE